MSFLGKFQLVLKDSGGREKKIRCLLEQSNLQFKVSLFLNFPELKWCQGKHQLNVKIIDKLEGMQWAVIFFLHPALSAFQVQHGAETSLQLRLYLLQ